MYDIQNPKLTAKNPHFGNKYAPLDEVLRVVVPFLEKQNCDLQQTVQVAEGITFFVTRLLDREGNTLREVAFPFPSTNKAQELGSAITYCRRYGILLLFNLVGEEDDDGNAATPKTKAKAKKAPANEKETW